MEDGKREMEKAYSIPRPNRAAPLSTLNNPGGGVEYVKVFPARITETCPVNRRFSGYEYFVHKK